MVVLPHIGTLGKLKYRFSLSVPSSTNINVEPMLKANDIILKNQEKLVKHVYNTYNYFKFHRISKYR